MKITSLNSFYSFVVRLRRSIYSWTVRSFHSHRSFPKSNSGKVSVPYLLKSYGSHPTFYKWLYHVLHNVDNLFLFHTNIEPAYYSKSSILAYLWLHVFVSTHTKELAPERVNLRKYRCSAHNHISISNNDNYLSSLYKLLQLKVQSAILQDFLPIWLSFVNAICKNTHMSKWSLFHV